MKKPKGESWTPVHTFRPDGAAPFVRVVFKKGEWVALRADGSTGWRFNPDRQEWVDTAPKNFVELIELKKREFEERTGQNLLEAMAPYEGKMIGWSEIIDTSGNKLGYQQNVGYGGFYVNEEVGIIRKPWTVGTAYFNLGSGRLPLESKVSGAGKDDFALVIVGARPPDPELGQTEVQFMPLIVGASLNGNWASTEVKVYNTLKGTIESFDGASSPQGLEKGIEENYARLILASSIIRLQNMEDLNGVLYDTERSGGDLPQVFKTLMDQMENGYVRRFSGDNSPLGQVIKGRDGDLYGGEPTLETLFNLLGSYDIGLFTNALRFYK
jgi:hypothetical protein